MARPRGTPLIIKKENYAEIICKHCNFIIDIEDVPLVTSYNWFSKKSGSYFYAYAHHEHDKKVLLHRLVLNAKSTDVVDHKNRNTLDNRKTNLRICSKAENNRNSKKNIRGTSSIYKGVTKRPSGRFGVYINYNKKPLCLGTYDTEKEAAIVYNNKAVELFGEYANLNKIMEGEND